MFDLKEFVTYILIIEYGIQFWEGVLKSCFFSLLSSVNICMDSSPEQQVHFQLL